MNVRFNIKRIEENSLISLVTIPAHDRDIAFMTAMRKLTIGTLILVSIVCQK